VASATNDAIALGLITIEWISGKEGTRYAIFRAKLVSPSESSQSEHDDFRRRLLEMLRRFSSIEIELAATADFLRRNGYAREPWAETERRKSSKVDAGRLAASRQLLRELYSLREQS
jgi:hypothetical protein